MKPDNENRSFNLNKIWKIVAVIFVLFVLFHYWGRVEGFVSLIISAATPLIVGFVAAYVINLPMAFFERKLFKKSKNKVILSIKRTVCLILSVLLIAALVFLVFTLIIPELINCFELLAKEIPPIIENFFRGLEEKYGLKNIFRQSISTALGEEFDWHEIVEKIINVVGKGFGGVWDSVLTVLSRVFSAVINVFLSAVFAIYLLFEKEKLKRQIATLSSAYIKESIGKKLLNIVNVANESFHKFIVGQCTEALILGVLCIIGMHIFRFPYATMIGTLIGFTAIIPIAGAYIGAGIGAFMVFTADSFLKAVLFIVFILILQQLEGNIIYPKVVGASIGLPGMWVLAAITIGGTLGGIIGMLLAVPLVATVYKLVKQDIVERKALLKENDNSEKIAQKE